MTTLNAYATLKDYKDYIRSRGGTVTDDVIDDAVIELLLRTATRYIESQTGRSFVPWIETLTLDVPMDTRDPRLLQLDNDLLEVITLTNGDGTVIPSTEYKFRNGDKPANRSPYGAIRLIDNSTYYWSSDGSGDTHDVITLVGVFGYHDRYASAWLTATTAAEAMDASETGYDVTSGTPFAIGNLIRFDNEFGYVSAIATNTLTTTRGENGSTATTHDTAIAVKIWQVMEDAKTACIEIANNAYHRRFGKSNGSTERVTAAGIILMPLDIPKTAQDFINTYRRYA